MAATHWMKIPVGAHRSSGPEDFDTSTAWHIQVEAISTVALVRRSRPEFWVRWMWIEA